jgi:hypothetical protein
MGVDSETGQTAIFSDGVGSHAMQTPSSSSESPSAAADSVARLVITLVACAMAWYTWGHWGNFQIDNGRELYVPAEILKGKLLFRDLWYMYGPLAPYLKALLFRIFGVHLTVLYVFGLTLTIGTALVTFEITRCCHLGPVGNAVPSLFFLVEAFYPFIRNFVFPYSYAASLAAFLGLACLYFVMRHASSARPLHLGIAVVLACLVILTKQEFGLACLALLGFEVAARYLIEHSAPQLVRNIAVCLAGLLPSLAVYGWIVWKLSAKVFFGENWISTPGTYFMRTFSKVTMPEQGFRFVPAELVETAEYTALALALWALLAFLTFSVVKRLRLRSRWSISIASLVCLSPMWVAALVAVILFPRGVVADAGWASRLLLAPMNQAIFPAGIFFLVVLFSIHALWKLARRPRTALAVQESALGIYATLIAVRQMMELRPTIFLCSVFFNVPAFLIFVILIYRIIRWTCRSLDGNRGVTVAAAMMAMEAGLLFLLFFPKPGMLPARLTTPYGSFYTRADITVLFPQIISFMKTHTHNGKDILILPEPPSLYVFAGMEAPSKWYSLLPGVVAPEQEQDYINELDANQVRYVLISNRPFVEYGVLGFMNGGYNPRIHQWIMSNYVKVEQFGPLKDAPFPPYIMWVFEKKNPKPAN